LKLINYIIIIFIMAHIDLVVDRSGSMDKLFWATVNGLTEFVKHQQSLEGAKNSTISLITFDDVVETPVTYAPLPDYVFNQTHIHPRNTTALYDALGKLFEDVPFDTKRTVVIVTDGEDNASRKFTASSISDQITERRKFGWTFIFLAANQDAIATGQKLSIPAETSCTFDAENDRATMGVIRAASDAIARGQSGEPVAFTQLERETSGGSYRPQFNPQFNPPLTRPIPSRSATGYPTI
jgi:uncharacterized protein YegL